MKLTFVDEAMAHILYHRIKYLPNPQSFHSSKLKHQIRTSPLFSEYLNLQIKTDYLINTILIVTAINSYKGLVKQNVC